MRGLAMLLGMLALDTSIEAAGRPRVEEVELDPIRPGAFLRFMAEPPLEPVGPSRVRNIDARVTLTDRVPRPG